MKHQLEKFIKTYFFFSKTERKGILTLLSLIILVWLFPYVFEMIKPVSADTVSIEKIQDDYPDFFDKKPYAMEGNVKSGNKQQTFSFDPNTASESQLEQLGFSKRNIKTMKNYTSKGGKFRKFEDLEKIYGLETELLQRLKPFVKTDAVNSKFAKDSITFKNKSKTICLELNSCDSTALEKLYRIGPVLAGRIIDYRNKLGGFVSLEQLKEIWGFDEDILYDLQGKIRVNSDMAKRYNLNSTPLEDLKKHPYLKYKLSNAIFNYRLQHGPYKSMEDLRQIKILNDSIIQKIGVYFYVE